MNEHTLPDEAVFEIEAWARRNDITGETVAEREAIVNRICEAVENANSDND